MKTQAKVAVLIVSLATANAAVAQSGWVRAMSRTPMTQFNDDDVEMFMQAGQKALAEEPDGGSQSWKNEATGHYGSIKVLSSLEIDGMPCREVEIENQSRSYFNRTQTTWCQHEDDRWLWQESN